MLYSEYYIQEYALPVNLRTIDIYPVLANGTILVGRKNYLNHAEKFESRFNRYAVSRFRQELQQITSDYLKSAIFLFEDGRLMYEWNVPKGKYRDKQISKIVI